MTLAEILTRRGIRFRLSPAKDKISLNCMFCVLRGKGEDTGFRLAIHTKHFWGRCLRCDWKHRYAIKPVLEALRIEDRVTGFEIPQEVKQERIRLPEDFQVLTKIYDELDSQARRYVLSRGVSKAQIRENRIGVSYSGKYAYRIIFPIYMNGKLTGFNARDFTGKRKPKYLLSPHEKSLYNFNPKAKTVILSEGVFKALRIARITEHNSAALLGHDLTNLQMQQMIESDCQNVWIYPDLELVGKKGALRIADRLCSEARKNVSFIWPVALPADENPFVELRKALSTNVKRYQGYDAQIQL